MDIRQLRAGNLVTTNGKPAGTTKGCIYKILDTNSANRLDELGLVGGATLQILDGEYRTTVGAWLDYLEPIEITDELLEKIGFQDRDTFLFIKLSNYEIDIFNKKLYRQELHLGIYEIDYNETNKLNADVKYLHQLQNLILDITGLDLNVDNLITK